MTPDWGKPAPPRIPLFRSHRWLLLIVGGFVAAGILALARPWLRPGAESPPHAAAEVRATELLLLDATTRAPIDAAVTVDDVPAVAVGAGRYAVHAPEEAAFGEIWVEGYRPARLPARRDAGRAVELLPSRVQGIVTDAADGAPIQRAVVRVGSAVTYSESDGRFRLEGVPQVPRLDVVAPGYRAISAPIGDLVEVAVGLQRHDLRGAYLTFYGVADPGLRGHVLQMLASGALNALVLDVKGDLGYLLYESEVPLAARIGANDILPAPDTARFVADLKGRGVYTIARIVVFKDDVLARNGPKAGLDVAVRDAVTGGLWSDGERLGWVDPFHEDVWAYNIALAEEAIRKGFDEVQFDYVRFPTDPGADTRLGRAVFSRPASEEARLEAVTGFLSRARHAVNAAGGVLAADVFGYVCWREDDMGIGQHLETLAGAVDYLSPMVYPSTFNGLPTDPAYIDSAAHPYEIVYHSLARARERLAGTGVGIRPWLQYFDDYTWASAKPYGASELRAQRRAVEELGLPGWMWWDPTNRYRHGAATQ